MNKFDFIELYDEYEIYCEVNKKEKGLRTFKIFVEKYNNINDNITNIMNTKKDIIDIYDIMIIEYKKYIRNIIDTSFVFVNCNFEKQKEFKEKMYKSFDDIK